MDLLSWGVWFQPKGGDRSFWMPPQASSGACFKASNTFSARYGLTTATTCFIG